MARIRTVKPELAAHEGMFDLEQETGLPLRFAWVMLFTVADREGRFVWRPRTIKAQTLPHDAVDFSRVLDAWLTRGFVVKYRVGGEWFGLIPTFTKHQVINNREATSDLPGIEDADEVIGKSDNDLDASGTRQARDDDACGTREVHAQAEGRKGREGERKEGREDQSSLRSDLSAPLALTPPADLQTRKAERTRQIAEEAQQAFNEVLAKPNGLLSQCTVLNKHRLKAVEKALPTARQVCKQLYGAEKVTPQFWRVFFEEVEKDDFCAGRGPYGGQHANWRPDFEYLLREDVMARIIDRGMTEAAA